MSRVLLAGKYVPTGPNSIGGLQSWIKTVRSEMERLGHEVVEWQPDMPLRGMFDLGVFANLALTMPALRFCRKTVGVSHGIIDAERPVQGPDRWLFVSEGVRAHWGWDGGVIRQPIDLGFWRPSETPRKWLTRYSYRKAPIHGESVAEALGFPYRQVLDVTHMQARDALRGSCLVFATGRAALESMACGTPTVIYDHRAAYQGALLGTDLREQMENSYSGRGGIEDPSPEEVAHWARVAMAQDHWRGWVEEHHDSRRIVEEILN